MTPLHAKLMRDLWRIKAQAAAIMVVIAIGVGLQIMMTGFVSSLTLTRDAYYERHQLADIFAPVVRAPNYVESRLADIPGIRTVETRLNSMASAKVDTREFSISMQVLSLPLHGRRHLNEVRLTQGRMPDAQRPDEILLLESFATAHGIAPGAQLEVTLHGVRRWYSVVGTAQSPEFIYFAAPGEFIPDDARFGVIWMGRPALAAALDLEGAFNEALVSLLRGANKDAVLDQIDQVLDPFGAPGAYGLEDFASDRFLSEEISGLEVTSSTVPPVFMMVAAFLLYIVTSRMITAEREEIGLVRAFGYSKREVASHYLELALFIAVTGAALGCLLGVLLGRAMVPVYTTYYKLPFLLFRLEFASFASGLLLSIAVATLGGIWALRGIFRLTPAQAMRPPTPPDFSHSFSFKKGVFARLDQPTRMVLRRLMRQPWRMLGAVIGIASGMALSLAMLIIYDGFDVAIDRTFNVVDRSDATVSFVQNVPSRTIYDLQGMEGISHAEPVRFVPVVFRNGLRTYKGSITGLSPAPILHRALDKDLQPIALPERGIVLSTPLADELDVAVGDTLMLEIREGRQQTVMTQVAGIAESLLGAPAYMDLAALGRQVGEPNRFSAAYIAMRDGAQSKVYADLKDMPSVAGISLRSEAEDAFKKVMDEGAGSARFIMGVMAFAITFGIVYNVARVAQDESARDLASLRVLGFRHSEAAFVLLGELAVVVLLALPLGLWMGTGLSHLIAQGFSTDLYQIPVIFAPKAYGSSISVVVCAAVVSGWLVQRRIRSTDITLALKTRE